MCFNIKRMSAFLVFLVGLWDFLYLCSKIVALMKKKETLQEFLIRKKAKDGRLSKLGEWLLSDNPSKMYVEIKDMRAVLR